MSRVMGVLAYLMGVLEQNKFFGTGGAFPKFDFNFYNLIRTKAEIENE